MKISDLSPRARFLGILVIGLATAWIALGARSCVAQRQVDAAMAQADQHHQQSTIHAAQGGVYDQQAEAREAALKDAEAKVASLRTEVARLRRAAPPAETHPGPAADQPVDPPVDLAPLVAKQDELIAAQDVEITHLRAQTLDLTRARDAWRQSAQASAAEAVQLRAALAAKEGSARAERWKGRIEGLVVGVGIGYVGGKFR